MRLQLTLAALAALTIAPPGVASDPASSAERELAADLRGVIESQGWSGDRWSVLVMSLDAGDTLFAHGAEAALTPASNLKLFTTAAALHYLGPDYRYITYVTARGPVRSGVLEGDLLVYGTGDPTLAGRFFDSRMSVIEALADSLRALGIQRVAGDLVGDASYFEGAGFGRGWETSYVTHTYAAQASALSFNENVVTLRVTPAETLGAAPDILLVPGGGIDLRNEARTVASGRSWIEVQRESYEAPIVVRGQIRKGASALWRAVPVVDPAHYAASVFREVLEARGIVVDGAVRSIHLDVESPVTGRKTFAPALEEGPAVQVLAVHRSPPLQEILTIVNKRSHNLYAESVLRSVGRVATGHGSVQGGAAAVEAMMQAAGAEPGAVHMDDGSGLSTLDRASARSIVQILAFMDASPHARAFRETLPLAAVDRGLRRMHRTDAANNLRAKTGTIDRVSSLSGYVTARNGERLAFAIISNNVPSTWKAKRLEDRIGARLASFDRPVPTGAVTARSSAPPTPDMAAPAEPEAEPASREATSSYYTIRTGDTLDGIARRHGVSLTALQDANPGVNPRRLMPGDRVRLPGG